MVKTLNTLGGKHLANIVYVERKNDKHIDFTKYKIS